MNCTGIHQVVDVEWKFGGKSSYLSRICVTLYISSPSLRVPRVFHFICGACLYFPDFTSVLCFRSAHVLVVM
jgi:hypothetical protein